MKESLETAPLPLIHNWTKGQGKQREVQAPLSLPRCTSCELLEVRAPGFQGQLSGYTGCELMLMKAAQPCKQHERMSLEYITIHNCLPRRGAHGSALTHHHLRRTHCDSSQPTWMAHRPEPAEEDKCWNDGGTTHNRAILPKMAKGSVFIKLTAF